MWVTQVSHLAFYHDKAKDQLTMRSSWCAIGRGAAHYKHRGMDGVDSEARIAISPCLTEVSVEGHRNLLQGFELIWSSRMAVFRYFYASEAF